MSVTVAELRAWLKGFEDTDTVGIDADAMTLVASGAPYAYIEVGSIDDEEAGA